MREFDARLMEILKTETIREQLLRTSEEARNAFTQEMILGSKEDNATHYRKFPHRIVIGRVMRYANWPEHKNNMLQTTYVMSGKLEMTVGGERITVLPGEFIIPGQETMVYNEPLGQDDIAINFMMRLEFLEELLMDLSADNKLTDFLMSALRGNCNFNSYIHFKNLDDPTIQNLAETLIYAAFPYMDDTIIADGVNPDPKVTSTVLTALYMSLGKSLPNMVNADSLDPTQALISEVEKYIQQNYREASLEELAARLNQSESSLSRQIKKCFGMNFRDLLLQRRFEQAEKLLCNAKLSVCEVAVSVGYENTSFFYRKFKEIYGISPNEYRKDRETN